MAIPLAIDHAEFTIITDQKSLVQLSEQRLHTPWQQKVFTKLSGLQYRIVYRRGSDNCAADALSRYSFTDSQCAAISAVRPLWLSDIVDSYAQDLYAQSLLTKLAISPEAVQHFTLRDGILHYKSRIWVANVPELHSKFVAVVHDSELGGHSGFPVTYCRTKLFFSWTSMKASIWAYVSACVKLKQIILKVLAFFNRWLFQRGLGK